MATQLEYFLFRDYSKAVKEWLQNTVYLSSYPKDNNVTIAYMTPERAFAEIVYPVVNGKTMSPNINFYLESFEYKEGENILGFVREYKEVNGENRTLKPPLIYKLTYSCSIYTSRQSEMDIILYQLLTNAHAKEKAAFKVDGQWVELLVENIRSEDNLQPGEIQDIVKRTGFSITIDRAYLPRDYDFYNKITTVDLDYEGV